MNYPLGNEEGKEFPACKKLIGSFTLFMPIKYVSFLQILHFFLMTNIEKIPMSG